MSAFRIWKKTVENIDNNWPVPVDMKSVVENKLNQLKKETRNWENATLQASK